MKKEKYKVELAPLWETRDGIKFYSAAEIGDMHLINIARWVVRNNKQALPIWVFNELNKRGLWKDTETLIVEGQPPPNPKRFSKEPEYVDEAFFDNLGDW